MKKNYVATKLVETRRGLIVNGWERLENVMHHLGATIGTRLPMAATDRSPAPATPRATLAALFESSRSAIKTVRRWTLRIPLVRAEGDAEIAVHLEHVPDPDNEPWLIRVVMPSGSGDGIEDELASVMRVERGLTSVKVEILLMKQDDRFTLDLNDVVRRMRGPVPDLTGPALAQRLCVGGPTGIPEIELRTLPGYTLNLGLAGVRGPAATAEAARGKFGGRAATDAHPRLVFTLRAPSHPSNLPVIDPVTQRQMRQVAAQIADAFED